MIDTAVDAWTCHVCGTPMTNVVGHQEAVPCGHYVPIEQMRGMVRTIPSWPIAGRRYVTRSRPEESSS